ncbi:winged helix-turn-helix domain-containing protein [Sulfolobales archaeon HS-7]|nr:winged helix-turn-helix domain-containing protein [Sulfolobales archaeon HS-7]
MSDAIDKKILFHLLRDGRASQRAIAVKLALAPPVINYRYTKLRENNIIKGFSLKINPNIQGKYYGYIALKNSIEFVDNYAFSVKCLEETNVYEIIADSLDDLKVKISSVTEKFGEPIMTYIPRQELRHLSKFDTEIIYILKEQPRIQVSEIAEKMKVSTKTVKRHLNYLESEGMIRVLPIIDLTRAGLIVFALFTRRNEKIREVLDRWMFVNIADDNYEIVVCATENMNSASRLIKEAKNIDNSSQVMIVEEYEVKSLPEKI